MIIANKTRKENIAEYLLYMWQVEDLIRANEFSIDNIERNIISRYDVDAAKREEIRYWYENLSQMMLRENLRDSGHLQINKNVIIQLTDLHLQLLKAEKFPSYGAEFYRTLPFIVELRAKSDDKVGELETCFNALYGMFMLKLQQKEISEGTLKAMQQISRFIATLAAYFKKDEEKPLFADDEL